MTHTVTTQIAATLGRLHLVVTFDPQGVGRRIAAARIRKGWTQLDFALQANISPSSVSRWERGKLPPVRELVRIAGVLDVDVAELVEEEEPPARPGEAAILAELAEIRAMLAEALGRDVAG